MTRIQQLEIEIAAKASLEKSLRDELNVAEAAYLESRRRWCDVYMARQDAERELIIEQRVAARACEIAEGFAHGVDIEACNGDRWNEVR